jgi:hypothetical protein
LQVGGVALNDLVAEHFDVVLHRTVIDEAENVVKREYQNWKRRGLVSTDLSELRRHHAAWISDKRSAASDDADIGFCRDTELKDLDAGELDCIALAKGLADSRTCYIVFITDDYRAGEAAETFFELYQCGVVIRSADLISFFGIRYKMPKPEIHQSLRDLISIYTNQYEYLLREVESILPGSEKSHIFPLVRGGDFLAAKRAISRLLINVKARQGLIDLVDKISEQTNEKSIVSRSFNRLRDLEKIRI